MVGPFNDAPPAPDNGGELTLVNGRTFTVARPDGSLRQPTDGTVFEDLRILSTFTVSITDPTDPRPCRHLRTVLPVPFHAIAVFQPDPRGLAADGEPTEYYVHRQWVGRGARHDIEVHNAAPTPIRRRISVELGADFAHLFSVKAGHPDMAQGAMELTSDGNIALRPDPATGDDVLVTTQPVPDHIDTEAGGLRWEIECPARSEVCIRMSFEPRWADQRTVPLFPIDRDPDAMFAGISGGTHGADRAALVSTDRRLTAAFDQALDDLAALRIYDPAHPDRVVVAAGAPWYMTLFGRDSLLTSWMALPFEPDLAVGVLRSLAQLQGSADDPTTEEEPGRIIHELRRHSANAAFGSRGRYYGTIDATPLFVMLAAEAHRWGHLEQPLLDELWPAVDAAVAWIRRRVRDNPRGLVAYERSSASGLVNQGWKDSWDGIGCADGTIPEGPIALTEVQGYAFAALRGAAALAPLTPHSHLDVGQLLAEAERLRERVNTLLWDDAASSYALGVTDDGLLLDAVTTNPGHALWCGIADDALANRYLDRCLEADMWTGWGLRTLSTTAARYNPLSYHNGSVWPHDTALVAAGAARYGRFDVVRLIIDGALDAADAFDGRPPELFAGIARSEIPAPVSYPSSCSPQAWSSASTLLHVRTGLDLEPGPNGTVESTNHVFPERTSVHGVRIGRTSVVVPALPGP